KPPWINWELRNFQTREAAIHPAVVMAGTVMEGAALCYMTRYTSRRTKSRKSSKDAKLSLFSRTEWTAAAKRVCETVSKRPSARTLLFTRSFSLIKNNMEEITAAMAAV